MFEKVEELLESIYEFMEISIDEIDLDFIRSYFNIGGTIKAQLTDKEIYDYDWEQNNEKTDYEVIREIFDR